MKSDIGQDLAKIMVTKTFKIFKIWWISNIMKVRFSTKNYSLANGQGHLQNASLTHQHVRSEAQIIFWVKIDPWPRFGHIFVHITFSKLPKITWKWRILIDSQAGSISYQKALAKGQREMKNQSFWLTNVILANTCLKRAWKSFPAKIWPLLLPTKSSKIKKYDEIHAYSIQVHR